MAQKKLLRRLEVVLLAICMGLLLIQNASVTAEAFDGENSLREEAKEMTAQYLINKLNEGIVYGEDLSFGSDYEDSTEQYELKIFVSNSMPRELLKTYAKEAKRYEGVLIFKGLPEGSFKYLSSLVMSLGSEEDLPAMQIDQEAFEFYKVNSVPVVVLQKNKGCFGRQNCKQVFDKIIGNVGIRAALEKFRDAGDLQELAGELLD